MVRRARAFSFLAAVAILFATAPVLAQKKPTSATSDNLSVQTDPNKPEPDPNAPARDPGATADKTDADVPPDETKPSDTGGGKDTADRGTGDDDCLDEKATTTTAAPDKRDSDCLDKDGNKIGLGVVAVPDILVDLFPGGGGANVGGESQFRGDTGGGSTVSMDGGQVGTGGIASDGTPVPQPRGSAGGGSNTPNVAAPGGNAPLVVSPQAVTGDHVPDEVLVTIEGTLPDVVDIATAFGLEVRSQRRSELLGVTIVRYGIPDGRPVGTVLAQLDADPRTRERVPNHVLSLQQASAVVNYAFKRISLDSEKASGADVKVAVIDTGVDASHPALSGVIAAEYDAMPDLAQKDRNHGTSIAGLIAGVGPFRGMAPGSKIYHARAFEGGKSTMDVILDALDWAASQDVRIVNMSFVGPDNDLLKAACASARARGMVLVAAAGNNGPGAPYGYPGAYPGVIAVTATDADDALMPQANRGPYVYVSAPGVDMLAPVDGGTDAVTGTSFAAAIVSGAVANLLHGNPDRSAVWVEKALAETASDLGEKGRDQDFGFGLINAEAAAALRQ